MLIDQKEEQWIGFCQKRRFFINYDKTNLVNRNNINDYLFDLLPTDFNQYDVILCKPLSVSGVKRSKIFKRGFKSFLKNPSILFDKKNKTYIYILICIMVMGIYKKLLV